jgi:hypothetical protein
MRLLLVLAASLLLSPLAAAADALLKGTVVSVVGQRVTLADDKGKQLTLTIRDAATLKKGDRISVQYRAVGDALLASTVTRLP